MQTFFSPAKINLLLDVHHRRDDGYHDLSSLVVGLDFGDLITIEISNLKKDVLACNDPNIPCDERNLILKGMNLLRKELTIDEYFKFTLNKKIPAQAGFGGGSSNATTALNGVLSLIEKNISDKTLNYILSQIGADCTFFKNPVPSMMSGIGEIIEPLDSSICQRLKGQKVLIYKPSFSISTANAYNGLNETSFIQKEHTAQKMEAFKKSLNYKQLISNSFTQHLEHKYISLKSLLKTLNEQNIPSMISGSGSGCFSLLSEGNANNHCNFVKNCVHDAFGKDAFFEEAHIL
jgi:4-diphosphocytidyl-2-C-methyl-D-erythritol kinase